MTKRREWTSADVKQLRTLAKARLSGTAIAKKLRRSHGAVAQKALRIGVSFRSIRRTRKGR